jgi:hypothetical protein
LHVIVTISIHFILVHSLDHPPHLKQ